MRTGKEVQQQFMAEFDALLKRWDAVISAEDFFLSSYYKPE